MSEPTVPRGAYGLLLDGLVTSALVAPAPESWPRVRLERRPADGDAPAHTRVGTDVAEFAFASGWSVRVDRRRRSATFYLPTAVGDDELVHPYLAPAAMQFAGWFERDAFHGGAFVAGGGAWAVLAERSGGKSTTLARLAQGNVPVLVDDALVVDGGTALAGPRCIDLRPPAAAGFGDGLETVRGGDRRRLALPGIAPTAPLRGSFLLEWGEELELRPLSPAERLVALLRHCRRETADRPTLLALARLPAWRLRRPPRPASLDDVCGKLLEAALG